MLPLWKFLLQRKQFSILLILALIAAGFYSLAAIPKESAPEVRIPVGIVTTILPGASAEDVEKLVTNKIEDGVANIKNLDKLTSTSGEGISNVTVQFDARADLDKSIQDLKSAVDAVKPDLPSEARTPIVSDVNFADQPILVISVTANVPPQELTKLGNDVRDELKAVNGVSKVVLSGVRDREVQVIVKKSRLEQYGTRIGDVVQAIQASNASLPVGSLTVDGVQYALNFKGDLRTSKDVADIALVSTFGPIYLRDIADIRDGVANASTISRASYNNKPSETALTLSVYKSSGGNVVRTADAVKVRLKELQSGMLRDSSVVVSIDLGKEVNRDLTDLTRTGVETMILVMVSLFLTIGWRESLVAAASIPLSFLIAFIGLQLSGNSLNFVSLFALILAIGILVDSGIVVTEAIHTRMQRFATKEEAALESLREYAWPLIAGTMATVAVFFPLFFISGIVGQFIKSIPFTLIFILVASIFVALGLVPLIAVLFTTKSLNRLEKKQEEYTHIAHEWYRSKLTRFLENRHAQNYFLTAIVVGLLVSFALPISGLVKTVFFPQEDVGYVTIEIEKPQGTALAQTDLVTRAVEEKLYGNPDIESFVTTVGSGSYFTNDPANGPSSASKIANITIILKDKNDRKHSSTEVINELRAVTRDITGAIIHVAEPNNGPPSGAPVVITFSGDSLDDLEAVTERTARLLASINGTTDVTTSMKDNGLQFSLTIDRAKAAAAGVNPAIIAQTLRAAVNGVKATTIHTGSDDIDVTVKMDLNPVYREPSETTQVSPDVIRSISLPTPQGSILLGSVLKTNLERGSAPINHKDRTRIATVSSNVTNVTTATEVTNALSARTSELQIPQGVSMKIGGETEDINKSFSEMGLAFVAGILLMLGILVLEFNSVRHTLYLLSIVPLSLIGVFTGLLVTFQPLSFSSLLGVIALAGVIINHAIILLDSMHRISATRADLPHKEVIVEAAISRLRPIVLTTITTVVGMIPLAGASALWGPLAYAIMFGLAFSMILTLILIPTLAYRWPGSWHDRTNGR